ncbi:MAG: hypothetical protein DMF55_08935 [Acidobacteria bacterium]|nr:MAG: hypothetical protein DMF55_08935 [Acidobacteriota bacterium]
MAGSGIARQHAEQTPPRKTSSTGLISHARQREGRKYLAAARPILWSAVAAGIASSFRAAILDRSRKRKETARARRPYIV